VFVPGATAKMRAFLLILVTISIISTSVTAPYCSGRGGCNCDCSWTQQWPCSTSTDDGSCCWGCCCSSSSAPAPAPAPASGGGGGLPTYCPSANDLTVAYSGSSTPNLVNQGWQTNGGGAVATKAAFNLLGGTVEFDINLGGAQSGVNANIYTISPTFSGSSFVQNDYCDGQKSGSQWCPEIDWIESNGNQCGQTTYHTIQGTGSGCTAWGCDAVYNYNGQTSFHMRFDYSPNGQITATQNGQVLNISPSPQGSDWSTIQSYYQSRGAVIYSSQWTGWTPTCPGQGSSGNGNLGGSSFSISNLRITGTVVQGPVPASC